MSRVFISYSRKDIAFVERLAKDIRNAGFDVWYDLAGLEVGKNWGKEIQEALRNSRFLIVVISPNSLESRWVEREYLFAENLNLKIIPILYQACELPLWTLDMHYVDMTTREYNSSLEEIIKALGNHSALPIETNPVTAGSITELQPGPGQIESRNETDPFELIKETVSLRNTGMEKSQKVSRKSLVIGLTILGVLGLVAVGFLGFGNGKFGSLFSQGFLSKGTTATVTVTTFPPTNTSSAAASTVPTPLAAGSSEISPRDGMVMVYVPKGTFDMGRSYPKLDLYKVKLDDFWIDRTEVTNSMYLECLEAGVCVEPGDLGSSTRADYFRSEEYKYYPVIHVNWGMAQTYCDWVGRRLPTEAEWEKAARGTKFLDFPWGYILDNNNVEQFANWGGAGEGDTTKVGSYEDGRSPYGAYDMAGNVAEWVADWYQSDYLATLETPIIDPQGPDVGDERVVRGGSWSSLNDNYLFTYFRDHISPDSSTDDIGFRCAVSNPLE